MAKIIGQVESLTSLRAELNKRKIYRFNSVGDIKKFERNFAKEKQNILKVHEDLLLEELKRKSDRIIENKNKLEVIKKEAITKLNTRLENYKLRKANIVNRRTSFIGKLIVFFKIRNLNREIAYLEENFDMLINNSIQLINTEIYSDTKNLSYLSGNKQEVILERSKGEINKAEYAKKNIDELRPLIFGAIGESLVEKEIKKLSDNYILINDYKLKFNPPIYNRKTNDRIYSIQLDHLLVSQAGLFILETKNWSTKSINSMDLRSPVDQIIRTSYALFLVVNNNIHLNSHHWGTKQIPIRNIIVMIHEKPANEFKYVKIKQLKELNAYLEYFDPIFSKNEVESIANFLLEQSS